MAHEFWLPPSIGYACPTKKEVKQVGWTKGLELAKVARADRQEFDCATWLHRAHSMPKEQFKREVEQHLIRAGD